MSKRRYSVPSLRVQNQNRWGKLTENEKQKVINSQVLKELEKIIQKHSTRLKANNN